MAQWWPTCTPTSSATAPPPAIRGSRIRGRTTGSCGTAASSNPTPGAPTRSGVPGGRRSTGRDGSPVRERPVGPSQMRPFQGACGLAASGCPVDVYAQPGCVRRDGPSRCHHRADGEDVVQVGPRPVVVLLLDPEGGARGVEVGGRGGHHRAERVVGGGPDVVAFGPAG